MNTSNPFPLRAERSGERLSRRSALRLVAGTALAFGIATLPGVVSRSLASQLYTVTANSNFRAGPGTHHPVMAVIPQGSTFTLTGDKQNDFLGVSYHGFGWVYGPLVVPAGQTSGDPVVIGEARASVNVNLRSGPSTGHSVLRVVTSGSAVNVSNTVQNGFRYVVHQGLAGWMADQYLIWGTHQPPGEMFVTTANLNLRAEPSLSARILLVMPSGSTVAGLDGWSNGFRKVSYKGTVGWASVSYLN